jgi:hypothetical protein
MARPPSKGVFIRSRWEWELDSAMSGWGSPAGIAGQLPYVLLYNNTATGLALKVYAIFIAPASATTPCTLGFANGNAGALQANNRGPLSALSSLGDGTIYQGNQVSPAPGSIFARLYPTSGLIQLVSDTPLFRLPPGYSLVAAGTAAAAALSAVTFWWVPEEKSSAN